MVGMRTDYLTKREITQMQEQRGIKRATNKLKYCSFDRLADIVFMYILSSPKLITSRDYYRYQAARQILKEREKESRLARKV